MKLAILAFAMLGLTFACKKTVKVGSGGGSGSSNVIAPTPAGDEPAPKGGEGDIPDAEEGAIEPSKAEETFSLVTFLKGLPEPELDGIKTKINPEVTKLVVGDQSKFSLETNTTMRVSPATDETAPGERKIESKFWVDTYMFGKKVKNIGVDAKGDSFMDASGTAVLDKLSMDAYYRYLGVDVSTKTITAGWEPRYTRDNEVKFGANVVVVGAEVSLRMGGEILVKFEFGVRRDNVLNLIFTPQAHITAGVSGQVKVLGGLGSAGPEGVTKMMDYIGRGNANLGIINSSKLLYADIGVDPGSMTFTDGKVDIVASSLGRTLWRKNVFDPKPLLIKKIPQYGATVVKFIKMPATAELCAEATAQAEKILNANKAKMSKYSEAVAPEDKPVIIASLSRMDELKIKIGKACSGDAVLPTPSATPTPAITTP